MHYHCHYYLSFEFYILIVVQSGLVTVRWHYLGLEREEDSYMFVSFLPTVATNQLQADSGSAVITAQSPLYHFFVSQFELIWQESKKIT